MMMHNEIEWTTHEWPEQPGRRRTLEEVKEIYAQEADEGRRRMDIQEELMAKRMGGAKDTQRRKLSELVHRQLHGYESEMEMENYMGGRLLGGSSSINGEQYVWPTKKLLEATQAEVGGDPDWSPTSVFALLRELEDYSAPGNSTQPRGTDGPLNVQQAPRNPLADGAGNDFVDAIREANPNIPLVWDYNDPANPLSVFYQWQLTQNPDGSRASSTTAMLPDDVRERKNLVIKTRATAMYIKFKKNVAQGIYFTHAGMGTTAYARKEVIVCAGHRSSFLLENSGVGNKKIIEPLLQRVGFEMVADVPGVGALLGNDGVVILTMNRPNTTLPFNSNKNDLYAGGAFLPWPNPNSPGLGPTDRFSQLLGTTYASKKTFIIGAILLNTSSVGWAHIQSADPLYAPLVTANTMQDKYDRANWWYLMRNQMKPIIDKMYEKGYTMINPPYSYFNDTTKNVNMKNMFDNFIFNSYIPAHHWYGTCKMGTDPKKGAVVDSDGRVYGVKRLRVADASIYPIKLDGNTGVPAYIAGAIVGKKILKEQGFHKKVSRNWDHDPKKN